MTLPKQVAKTLTSIMDHPFMQLIMDRSKEIDVVISQIQYWWGYDLYNRKPGPAYIDDDFVGTDLDLSCFLFELAERHAVINIPEYQLIRPSSIKKGFSVVSPENRHGQIIGLTSNKDSFLFSLRIKDMNTISSNRVGAFKNFALTNLNGDLYEQCKCLQFIPTEKENDFLQKVHILSANNNIVFQYFVHPNRWSSMFGHHYIITKHLIERLKVECKEYQEQIDEMLEIGFRYPKTGGRRFEGWPESKEGPGKRIKIESFQVEMEFPKNGSRFKVGKYREERLVYLTRRRNYLLWTLIPKLSFAVRTVELAYYKYGNNRIPHWLKNVQWEHNFRVPPRGRIKWDRIILFQNKVGELGISLKKRTRQISQGVSLDY